MILYIIYFFFFMWILEAFWFKFWQRISYCVCRVNGLINILDITYNGTVLYCVLLCFIFILYCNVVSMLVIVYQRDIHIIHRWVYKPQTISITFAIPSAVRHFPLQFQTVADIFHYSCRRFSLQLHGFKLLSFSFSHRQLCLNNF